MAKSVLERLKEGGYIQEAAEIDPDAAVATDDPVVVTDESAAEQVAIAEETVADADIAIEIRGDLEDADSIIIEIRKDDDLGESLGSAAEDLTETVITTEDYMKEGGMSAQTAQEHMRNLKRLGEIVGFKIPTALPTYESFGGVGSRLEATGLVYEEEQNWLKRLWETIKGWLKVAQDNIMKLWERYATLAGRVKARAEKIAANIMKRKQYAKAKTIKVPARVTALIGTGTAVEVANKVESTFDAAFKASEDRAVKFNNDVVSALNAGGSIKELKPGAITAVSGPAGWGFKSEGDKVAWESSEKGAEADFTVASREDIATAAKTIISLAESLLVIRGDKGKNAQAYKDSVAAGEKISNSVKAKGGAADSEAKKRITETLNALKDARTAFSQPGVAVAQWGGKAANAVLDVLSMMSRQYADTAESAAKREEKGAKKEDDKAAA